MSENAAASTDSTTADATATQVSSGGAPVTVPASAMSKFAPQTNFGTALKVANNQTYWYPLVNDGNTPFWWIVVFDLFNLTPVANVIGDGVNVPPAVQQYVGNPRYFVYVLSNCQTGAQIPYGNFYTFLQQVGGGNGLAQLEQVYKQFSSSVIHNYSYILAATMDTTDYAGYEALSFAGPTVLAMQFMPTIINNQQVYVPINPFS
jgi:hypothetical protein